MRWLPVAALLVVAPAFAQSLVAPRELTRVLHDFESRPGDTPLRCSVNPIPPALNFAFRFYAGYSFHVPLDESPQLSQGWSVLTAITPEGGDRKPAYLLAHLTLRESPQTDLGFEIRGLYSLGVGRYSVQADLRDDHNRICRKQWQVVVKQPGSTPSELPPNSVRDASLGSRPDTRHPDDAPPMRLSLLLNAAPSSQHRVSIHPLDRLVLLSSLTAMLEHLPTTAVRLVVFSLDQQREIFRSDHFTLRELFNVARAIDALELTTVDVHVLQKPLGHVDFLAGLIDRELHAPVPPDRVVFLGPPSRYGNKIPEDALSRPDGASPHFFYVQYQGPRRPPMPSPVAESAVAPRPAPGSSDGQSSPPGTGGSPSDPTTNPPPPPPRPPASATDNTRATGGDASTGAGTRGNGGGGGGGPGLGGGGGGGGRGSPGSRGLAGSLPPMPPPENRGDDIINQAVTRLKGKTLTFHSPADLAKAIRRIEQKP